ncbi:ArsR family transcriptional regulator [Pelosinus propionicus]|uniref:Regulatory protein, arsR family n=1 Tax=Pelosinus propionicus DSM 13327 TaxID=1123291 RepID=A0A1I4JG99_9FIRM|nr:ArsR family transcriptional regulator [Pelosinus propionicus]SFL65615.1 regulatory protein, arsR family [Pelosinus propionicus DSM 13327]
MRIDSDINEELLYSVKGKLRNTLIYLYNLARGSKDGYFHLDIEQCVRDLGVSESTIYRHLNKFKELNIVFRVYNGTRNPNELALELLKDAGKTIKGIGSLYYFPVGSIDSQLKKDIAILKYCFGWQGVKSKHYQWWCDAENLIYDDNSNGFSKVTKDRLAQFFQYVVHGRFEWNHDRYDCYMERFEKLRTC